MRRIRSHLTYANVVATIALFVAISGGTAVALNGSNTVQSDDIGPGAQVTAADVVNESLTGADIKNKSGVDTCVNTVRLGNLCFRAENDARPWTEAAAHCSNLNLRLPTYGEARQLARNYNLPNVDESEAFWTDEIITNGDHFNQEAFVERDSGSGTGSSWNGLNNELETVCVTTPTN